MCYITHGLFGKNPVGISTGFFILNPNENAGKLSFRYRNITRSIECFFVDSFGMN